MGQIVDASFEGKMKGETFGKASQISGNGLFLVVGAPDYIPKGGSTSTGRVSVYVKNDDVWAETSEIIGYGGSFGRSLAISEDGLTIVVGAPLFPLLEGGNSFTSGRVYVYKYSGTDWTLNKTFIGDKLAFFGWSISLSPNGQALAIGGFGSYPNGKVTVYEHEPSSGSWSQLGATIKPQDSDPTYYNNARFGYSVLLSNTGKRVVVGIPGNSSGTNTGAVATYDYNSTDNLWENALIDLTGKSAADEFGSAIALSKDGNTLAIGTPVRGTYKGEVSIFNYEVSSWEKVGGDFVGADINNSFGSAISVSDNGRIVTVGAYGYDNPDGGKTALDHGNISIFVLKVGAYVKQKGIMGEGYQNYFGRSVSMSSDGKTYAIGADGFNKNNGKAYIYTYNTSPTSLSLSSNTLSENNAVGAVVGSLSTEDPNSSDTFTYSLVSGVGDTDNGAFSISGANVLAGASFDFETKNSYSILVQTTDSGSNTLTKTFTISVTDLDEDSDGDGIINSLDNCPSVANASQADADGDGVGDVCDNAPNVANSDQRDTDGDGQGDVIDTDDDGDGVPDTSDDFPLDASEITDTDGDLIGDNADPDDDNDGVLDTADNCVLTANAGQADIDEDGIGDVCDSDNDNDGFSDAIELSCGTDPLKATDFPVDTDKDGLVDCLDPDDDNDGQLDVDELACGSDPLLATSMSLDTDADKLPNCVDLDDDNDGFNDTEDVFPLDAREWVDTDRDGIGNNADTDDDNDGQLDADELACGSDPLLALSRALDTDLDNIPDCVDPDDDNDGVVDVEDVFPLDQTEWLDTDLDGKGNNADTDDDNDGYSDENELSCNSDSLDKFSVPSDLDQDFIPDCIDTDIDGDGYLNEADTFPRDSSEWEDTDGDGLGDNFEVDDDNDGCLDTADAFPKDSAECLDQDGDGIGDNADPDDNNDGFEDDTLFISEVLTPYSATIENTWKIVNIEQYISHQIKVYNKQGQEVFSSSDYKNDWRGTFANGSQLLPAGPYYYKINLSNKEQRSGWLYLTY